MFSFKRKKVNALKIIRMVSLTLLISFAVLFTLKSSASGLTNDSFIEVTVRQGDTLWEIANQYNGDENIQKVIFEVMEFNNKQNSDLYPGEKLKIPIKY